MTNINGLWVKSDRLLPLDLPITLLKTLVFLVEPKYFLTLNGIHFDNPCIHYEKGRKYERR